MVPKRRFCEGEEESEGFTSHNQEAKRRVVPSNDARNAICGLSSQDLASTLEPLIRKWVREEVQRSCQSFFRTLPRSPIEALEPCRKTSLQLRFQAKLPNTFFTGSKIESEDNTNVRLVLFDVNSNKIVSSGPFSSLKVEIVPLDGDFTADDEEDWAGKDFEAKVISARDGRRPLITGDLVVSLQNGVGELGEICFTDNSSWRRSRKFMIGARVKDSCIGARIREAKSQAFIVKDHRGESYKKHHPPSLNDEIWRLEKIAKDGVFHKRLESRRIRTVKDFLQMYVTNQSLLRELLGGSSNKTWETIIKHAKDCILDDNLYTYKCDENGIELVLDSVFKIVGAIFDGLTYLSLDKLSVLQMPVVEALKQQVYKNLNGMLPMDAESIFGVPVVMSNLNHNPLKNSSLSLQGVNIPFLQQDEVEMHMYGVMDNSSDIDVNVGNEPCSMELFSPELRNSFIIRELSNGLGYVQDVDFGSGTSLWQGHDLFVDTSNQTVDIVTSDFGICYSGNGSPRARWCKIRAALKWDSVRRDVAAKKTAEMHSYLDFLV